MKFWKLTIFYAVLLLILSGCVATTPTPNSEPTIDATLETVELTTNGTFVDMNAIAFEWKSIKDQRVKGIYIYKKAMDEMEVQDEYYKTINSRFTTHFVDTQIKPDTQYIYYFKTFSDKAESLKSKMIVLNSLPVLKSVIWIQSVQNMPRSAKILWRPHTNEKVKAYIVERQTLEDSDWEKISTVQGRLSAEYIDAELKDKYVYKYRVRVLTFDDIISTPSKVVKVVTKSLPLEIVNMTATRNLPKKIELKWGKAIVKDFSHYNLYRAQTANGQNELIANLHKNLYVDKIDEDGKQYFYRVSAVDKDGLESSYEKQSIQGITLIRPEAPIFTEVKLVNNKVQLLWKKDDPRIKSCIVVKRYRKNWINEINEEFKGISGNMFVDSNVEPNITYNYTIYGVDKNGIKSEPSIEAEFKSDKLPVKKVSMKNSQIEVENASSSVDGSKNDSDTIMPTKDFN